ncbi:MFS transporter [Pelosinus sp. IPA-1]|uniref:MFS transporter n=1 Tax=Pelosinus sp. IPA-1 TaxID=3029569 RepID=UPI00243628AD|nr:MFS transporter [Pelosinus sp. IPA-1]GMB00287.1 NarK family nitrate/nitrite MFS transporter [Pelosinus sp. IPA-1]
MYKLKTWNPEDPIFWEQEGKKIANRNLWISVPALLISFCIWMLWSVVAVNLNSAGFSFSAEQLFNLAALPGLSGATLRIFYAFVVPVFGGRNWTVISTASLLIPAIGIGYAVQDTTTSYTTMVILAVLCGLGGGNFASSMGNINFFFPKKQKGTALGINGGLGNVGVSVVQFVAPLVITCGIFGSMGGEPQIIMNGGVGKSIWLQNAAFIWIIPIVLITVAAFFGMNNLETAKASVREQFTIFKCKHMWVMSFIYTIAFGSFIGYSAVFPLLIKFQFSGINPLQYAFLGPLVGALSRPIGGWAADKYGGARVSFWSIFVMIGATLGVIFFMNHHNFIAFFIMALILFVTSGAASGSTFGMLSKIFNPKEAAPAIGFISAVAAYGAFFVPKAFGWSTQATGSPSMALYGFIAFYIISLFVIYHYYNRRDAEIKC